VLKLLRDEAVRNRTVGGDGPHAGNKYRPLGEKPHWSEFDLGGHFAAMEHPELYVGDLRTFVGLLDGR
jgi:hypothetical protein